MRWVAIFEDKTEADWVRKQHSTAHFEYLAANRDRIVLAGGLRPAPGEWYCGGLWIMEVGSREEASRLVEGDPYFRLGLRKSYRLNVWGKAPCYGEVSLGWKSATASSAASATPRSSACAACPKRPAATCSAKPSS